MFPLLPGLGRGGVLSTFWKTAREALGEGSVTLVVAIVHPKAAADSATPWAVAHQAPRTTEFSRQQYWSGFAVSSSRGSSRPRDQTHVSHSAGRFFTAEPPGKPLGNHAAISTFLS